MKAYILAILIACTCTGLSTLAQPKLSRQQMTQFEGYYRSSNAKEMVVRIMIKDDTLVARPLWVNMLIHMQPKGELIFHTIEPVEAGPIDITFSRDSTGDIAALELANMNVKWLREKDYKPLVKKVMDHTPAQLRPYEGVYRLNREGARFLQFFVRDNDLMLRQVWDGAELPFHPESTQDFFTDNIPLFTLKFTTDQQGNVTQLLAFGHDLWIKTQQPELSQAALDAVSGNFQSKDDPDNQVTVTVKDKHLVVKQHWDNKEIALQPLAEDYFYDPAVSFSLQVRKDGSGKVKEIVLLDNNVFVHVP